MQFGHFLYFDPTANFIKVPSSLVKLWLSLHDNWGCYKLLHLRQYRFLHTLHWYFLNFLLYWNTTVQSAVGHHIVSSLLFYTYLFRVSLRYFSIKSLSILVSKKFTESYFKHPYMGHLIWTLFKSICDFICSWIQPIWKICWHCYKVILKLFYIPVKHIWHYIFFS